MKKFLLITDRPPWPPTDGARQRTNLMFRALASIGRTEVLLVPGLSWTEWSHADPERLRDEFNVVGVALHGGGSAPDGVQVIKRAAPRLLDRLIKKVNRWHIDYLPDRNVADWLGNRIASSGYDVLVGRYLRTIMRSGALSLPHSPPVILDVDDLPSQAFCSKATAPGESWLRRVRHCLLCRFLRRIERKWLGKPAHLWVTSDCDLAALGRRQATVLPNIPFNPPPRPLPQRRDSQVVLFVGSLAYDVNVQAIDRFVHNTWPQVKSACPQAVFRIVGRQLEDRWKARWAAVPGVEPTGFLPELGAAYDDCALAIAPIFAGGGTKIKVLEALSYGRACAVTQHSQRGFENLLRHGESLLVAKDEAGLAADCLSLIRDPALRESLAARGAELVARNFSYQVFRSIVEKTVDAVLSRGAMANRT